jgi:cyanophycinase-like exopeptidase
VKVTLIETHNGYTFLREGNAVDKQVTGSGGLFLVGGGSDSAVESGYKWFLDQANHGDVVVIANGKDQASIEAQADYFFSELGKTLDSVEVFDFNIDSTTNQATAQAIAAASGREFLDRLQGAEAVFFMGGDQWPYVQVLKGTAAAQQIANRSNSNAMAVGGTSAGMAILGNYVFTAQYIRANGSVDGAALYSDELLANYHDSDFYQNGAPSVDSNILHINALNGVLTETHFTDPSSSLLAPYDQNPPVTDPNFRLGRFISFLGSVMLVAPNGLGQTSVKGLAVDDNTALAMYPNGTAQVFGEKNVYFAYTDNVTQTIAIDQNVQTGQAYLEIPHVIFHWFDATDGVFNLAGAWTNTMMQDSADYGIQNGAIIRNSGQLPLPFQQP